MRDVRRLHEQLDVGLDRVRLTWLLLGGAVSLGLTFAMGVVVGRNSVDQPAVAQVAEQEAPKDPLSRIDSDREMHDKLTFYRTLTEEGETVVKSRPAKAAPKKPSAPAKSPAKPAKADKQTTVPSPADSAAAKSAKADPPKPATNPLASALNRVRDSSRVDPKSVRIGMEGGPASAGEYTVQVGSFESLSEANAFAAGLQRNKGYAPFVVTAEIPGRGTWFRVRIGRFVAKATANEAQKMLAMEDLAGLVFRME